MLPKDYLVINHLSPQTIFRGVKAKILFKMEISVMPESELDHLQQNRLITISPKCLLLQSGPSRGGAEGVTVRGHRGARGLELSGLECKIYELKLRMR